MGLVLFSCQELITARLQKEVYEWISIVVNEKYMSRPEPGGEQYDIVSKVAYLLGVHKRIFENENEPPKLEVYDKLEQDKNARIIRNLCMLRTQLERNFLKVCHGIQREYRSMLNMPEYLSTDAMKQLYSYRNSP